MNSKLKNLFRSFFFLFLILLSMKSYAHPLDVVFFELEKGQSAELSACLSIHPTPLKKLLNVEILNEDSLKKNVYFDFSANEKKCTSHFVSAALLEGSARSCFSVRCESTDKKNLYEVKFNFFEHLDDSFVLIGKFKANGDEKIFKVDRKRPSSRFSAESENFFKLGIDHIGASVNSWTNVAGKFQIADGIDHILFLFALLLISTGWRSLILNVSGFTLGHSVALALAMAHFIFVPAAFIEPAIALSIAYVSSRGLIGKKQDSLGLTTVFGLLHGLGFSYVLENLKTSSLSEFLRVLFLFNVGIEIGQLTVILILTPLLIYLIREMKYAIILRKILSGLILITAFFWVVERCIRLAE